MHIFKKYSANIFCVSIACLCAAIYYKINVRRPIGGLHSISDFSVYYHAAQDVLAGISPYENFAYFYPPLTAFLFTPFLCLNYIAARWAWFLLSHGFLLFAGWLLWRWMGKGRIALAVIACLWALGGAAKETLDVGQITPLLMLGLVIVYTTQERLQAAVTTVGFALKYIPGILVLPLLWKRRWRALAETCAIGILTFCLPWWSLWQFFSGPKKPVSAHYWMGTPSMYSWSIPSALLRLLDPLHRGQPVPVNWEYGNVALTLHLSPAMEWASVSAGLAVLVAGVAALAWTWRGETTADPTPWAMAGLISLSLAAAPVCWSHYQLLQYPGAALLLTAAVRRRNWFDATAVVACVALTYQLPQWALLRYHDLHSGWTTVSPATLYFWTSVPAVACLGLFALTLKEIRRCRPAAAPQWEPANLVLLRQLQQSGRLELVRATSRPTSE